MLSIFQPVSPRGFNLKFNACSIYNIKNAEALGIWIFAQSYSDNGKIEKQKLIDHFGVDEKKLELALIYLLEKRLITINAADNTITALAIREAKEYTIPANVTSKGFTPAPISEK